MKCTPVEVTGLTYWEDCDCYYALTKKDGVFEKITMNIIPVVGDPATYKFEERKGILFIVKEDENNGVVVAKKVCWEDPAWECQQGLNLVCSYDVAKAGLDKIHKQNLESKKENSKESSIENFLKAIISLLHKIANYSK